MNQRPKSFRMILTENNALGRLSDFKLAHPDVDVYGGLFSYQEKDENGHSVNGNSVSILFDAMRCNSINEVFIAADWKEFFDEKFAEMLK